MNITIIHIVSSLQKINYGVFNAVTSTFEYLNSSSVKSILAFPNLKDDFVLTDIEVLPIGIDYQEAVNSIDESGLLTDVKNTMFVTHGNWKLPTKLGIYYKSKGYRWIVIPHGMLEPWSMRNKWYIKWPYYFLYEKKRLQKADCLIGVSLVETDNLNKQFRRVKHIANGITPFRGEVHKPEHTISFLFLSRLHHKKGVVPLAEAWVKSSLNQNSAYQLIIAGPDEGEGNKLTGLSKQSANIQLLDPQYDEAKITLLKQVQFFILPSFSEGFPTAVLEAMTYGCIPMISQGCNFPEAHKANVAIEISPNVTHIKIELEKASKMSYDDIEKKGSKAKEFVDFNYALENIALQQLELYKKLLNLYA